MRNGTIYKQTPLRKYSNAVVPSQHTVTGVYVYAANEQRKKKEIGSPNVIRMHATDFNAADSLALVQYWNNITC